MHGKFAHGFHARFENVRTAWMGLGTREISHERYVSTGMV
jgi:hypothetical protein